MRSLTESLQNTIISPLTKNSNVLSPEDFRSITNFFNKKKIYEGDPRFPYYYRAKNNNIFVLYKPDSSIDTVSCYSVGPLWKVGDLHYMSMGSTIEVYDNDGNDVGITVHPEYRRLGLGTAMVKYAMELTGATQFLRSDKETKLGKEFFPKVNESQQLKELFDSDTRDVVVHDDDGPGEYRMVMFSIGEHQFDLTIEADVDEEYGYLFDVYFHILDDNGNYNTKLQHFSDQSVAFKVFTFTGNIIQETINHFGLDEVRGLRFSALSSEPSRVRFYRTIANTIQKKIFSNPNPVREVVEKEDIVFYPENIEYVNALKKQGAYYESTQRLQEARAVFDYYQTWFFGKSDFDTVIATLDNPKYETWVLDNLVRLTKSSNETKFADFDISYTFTKMIKEQLDTWDYLTKTDKFIKAGVIPSKDLNVAMKMTRAKHEKDLGPINGASRDPLQLVNGAYPTFFITLLLLIRDAENTIESTSEFPGITVRENEYKIIYKKDGWVGVQVLSQKASYEWGRKTVPGGFASTCVSRQEDSYYSSYMGYEDARLMYFRQYPWTEEGLCIFYSKNKLEVSDLKNIHGDSYDEIPKPWKYPKEVIAFAEKFLGKDPNETNIINEFIRTMDITPLLPLADNATLMNNILTKAIREKGSNPSKEEALTLLKLCRLAEASEADDRMIVINYINNIGESETYSEITSFIQRWYDQSKASSIEIFSGAFLGLFNSYVSMLSNHNGENPVYLVRISAFMEFIPEFLEKSILTRKYVATKVFFLMLSTTAFYNKYIVKKLSHVLERMPHLFDNMEDYKYVIENEIYALPYITPQMLEFLFTSPALKNLSEFIATSDSSYVSSSFNGLNERVKHKLWWSEKYREEYKVIARILGIPIPSEDDSPDKKDIDSIFMNESHEDIRTLLRELLLNPESGFNSKVLSMIFNEESMKNHTTFKRIINYLHNIIDNNYPKQETLITSILYYDQSGYFSKYLLPEISLSMTVRDIRKTDIYYFIEMFDKALHFSLKESGVYETQIYFEKMLDGYMNSRKQSLRDKEMSLEDDPFVHWYDQTLPEALKGRASIEEDVDDDYGSAPYSGGELLDEEEYQENSLFKLGILS